MSESRAPRPIFYSVYMYEQPLRADRWLWQAGGTWCAVDDGEKSEDWFDGMDWEPWMERLIEDIPETGELAYRRSNGEYVTTQLPAN